MFVQFEDPSERNILRVFSVPQDLSIWPHQGVVQDDDPRYLAFLAVSRAASPEELAASERDRLLSIAAIRVAPLQDAEDLGRSTEDEARLLKLWKLYRVDLNRVEQQAGYPLQITWPVEPS
ncbi:Caudovirales tail fiber assembly protein [compost metagenome]|jgi:hypothetical protein